MEWKKVKKRTKFRVNASLIDILKHLQRQIDS